MGVGEGQLEVVLEVVGEHREALEPLGLVEAIELQVLLRVDEHPIEPHLIIKHKDLP